MVRTSGQHLRVEVLWLAADKFELRVIDADGTEHVEMFANPAAWQSAELQDALSGEGWTGPHGWMM